MRIDYKFVPVLKWCKMLPSIAYKYMNTKFKYIDLRQTGGKRLLTLYIVNQKENDDNHRHTPLCHGHGRNLLAFLRRTKLP